MYHHFNSLNDVAKKSISYVQVTPARLLST